jgi:hypothetical protein
MPWARLDDAILDNPKIIAAGPLGFALHVAAITWCARNLTDGFIPKRRVTQLLDLGSLRVSEATLGRVRHALTTADVAEDLARIGLWHDHGVSWELHDYLVYNPSKAEVLALREATRIRVERHRKKRVGNGPCNGVTNAAVTPHPVPVPVPRSSSEVLDLFETVGADAPVLTELGFDQFWAPYPKKRHKPDAKKAWKQVDGARQLEVILAGIARWKASEQWQDGRIEDPSTFLRQRQWEDDVPRRTGEDAAATKARIKAELFGRQP